jgi:hypothetical protein
MSRAITALSRNPIMTRCRDGFIKYLSTVLFSMASFIFVLLSGRKVNSFSIVFSANYFIACIHQEYAS